MTDHRRFKGTCKTQLEIIVAHLWQHEDWTPTHQLQNVNTPYGFIGSAGHVRARELARNDKRVPERLHNKIEKSRGGAIGLDPRYEYFRFRKQPTRADHLRIAAEAVRLFDNSQGV